MNQHIPYFYIIRHISTGKMYAGSRWGKNCHPGDLLVTYKTHSNKIRNIIKTEGIESFDILRTDSYCDGLHPYEYEKLFLEINDCANSSNWFNGHNNHLFVYGTEEYKQFMLKKYGVDNPNKIFEIQEKIKNTKKSRNTQYQEKRKQTSLRKYGVDHHMKSKSFIVKYRETIKNKTGFYNNSHNPLIKEKLSKANKGNILLFNTITDEKILVKKDSEQYKLLNLSIWKNKNANSKWMRCPFTNHKKMVKPIQLDYYMSIGYIEGSGKFTEEHKQKISAAHKSRLRE